MGQCTAVAQATGQRCRRRAASGAELCSRHVLPQKDAGQGPRPSAEGPRRRGDYGNYLAPEESAQMEAAAGQMTIDGEIALLRVLIRRALKEGQPLAVVAKGVDALGRALKVEYGLKGRAAKGLEEALARALDEIGQELGMTL